MHTARRFLYRRKQADGSQDAGMSGTMNDPTTELADYLLRLLALDGKAVADLSNAWSLNFPRSVRRSPHLAAHLQTQR